MAKKNISDFMGSLTFLVDFFAQFLKNVEKLGVTPEELYVAMKSETVREIMAIECANVLSCTRKVFTSFHLVKARIPVLIEVFSKKFFTSSLGLNVYMGSNFENEIIPELSEAIPAFEGSVDSLEVLKNTYESVIRLEVGDDDVYTVDEAIAILVSMVVKQPIGEAGYLIENGRANVVYAKLKSGEIVSVFVGWDLNDNGWNFDMVHLNINGVLVKNDRVFLRS